jgi:hypothetical protein
MRVNIFSDIVNVLKPVVFIEIAVSGTCITIAVRCIACTFFSTVGFFVNSPVISVATSVVNGLTCFIISTFGPLASITT